VAVDVRELRAAYVVVMQDGVCGARHHSKAMAPEYRFSFVAAVGQKARWSGFDCAFADRRGFRKHSFGVELMSPTGHIAHSPR
jgi:hypothetical protein